MPEFETADLSDDERAARARLDPGAYDFYATGSVGEVTLREAEQSWRAHRFLPRILRDVSAVDTGLDLLGNRLALPVLVAPTAFHSMAHPAGEAATAAGTAAAGSLFVLSSRATRPIEEVASAAGPWWYQVYVLRDRELTRKQVERAAANGAGALVLTVDAPVVARKARRGAALPLADEDRQTGAMAPETRTPDQEQDPSIGFDTIAELTRVSGLPVLVKGVLRPDDARACVEAGAAGVIVSNHGGRQLDRAVSAAAALPLVAAEVGGEVPVLVDGGIRSGIDVLTALALGARAVLLGRPVLWALAAGGADSVRDLLVERRAELAEAMTLAGARDLGEVTADLLAPRPRPEA
ncbi:alpha-hydroxy acid oxidase [Kitasatospora sp. NPDC056446]|uniref:alpha-hydroxy acid oxidase n=1 Tax=Kitasatospora sp. NPDC056446 TaxID=3345819 RepID=UPI00369DEE46